MKVLLLLAVLIGVYAAVRIGLDSEERERFKLPYPRHRRHDAKDEHEEAGV